VGPDISAASTPQQRALLEAANDALAAPSIYNTQPWRWSLVDDVLQLWADRDRQLQVTDIDARQLMISCGCALHHAVTALAAQGWLPNAARLPDPSQRALVAFIGIAGRRVPTQADLVEYAAIHLRHTDRRAFTAEPVPSAVLSALVATAENQGAHLHVVQHHEKGLLREAAQVAESAHQADPAYQAELAAWTNRPASAGDGIPPDTAVTSTARPVPVRSFVPPELGASAGPEHDAAASYGVIFTSADAREDCLRAGQALSAVLLTATAANLGTAPISDIIEVPRARQLVGRLLDGGGYPQIAFRVGHPPHGSVAASPRRDPAQVIAS
jgi:hypothetical protein